MVYSDWWSFRNWYDKEKGGKVTFERSNDERLYLSEPQQFTGLKDKNGKEIYEGDLLSHFGKTYEVKWDEKMAAFQTQNIKDNVDCDFFNWGNTPSLQTKDVPQFGEQDGANCEVIGNIWENPELLK